MIRKLLMRMICMVVLLVPASCFASLHDYPNIAVLDFDNKGAVSAELTLEDSALVSEFIIEELIDSDRFNVIERSQLKAIFDEHSLNLTGMVDPSTAVQLGKISGVKYLVYGSIAGLSLKEGMIDIHSGNIGTGGNKHTVIANLTARVIDVETGRVVLSGRGEGISASTSYEFSLREYDRYRHRPNKHTIRIGTVEVSQVQVHNALAKAATNVIYGERGLITKMDGKGKKSR